MNTDLRTIVLNKRARLFTWTVNAEQLANLFKMVCDTAPEFGTSIDLASFLNGLSKDGPELSALGTFLGLSSLPLLDAPDSPARFPGRRIVEVDLSIVTLDDAPLVLMRYSKDANQDKQLEEDVDNVWFAHKRIKTLKTIMAAIDDTGSLQELFEVIRSSEYHINVVVDTTYHCYVYTPGSDPSIALETGHGVSIDNLREAIIAAIRMGTD
jgi:hypothetical protein